MLAHKTAAPATEPFEAPDSRPAAPAPVWTASDQDLAAASPVHALHARLAREVDASPSRGRFGVVRPLILLANLACWWGLISLGMAILHH